MKIKISSDNLETMTKAIEAAQRNAIVRTITAEGVIKAIETVNNKLGISKLALKGVEVTIDINAQTFPKSYNGIPESTIFTAVHNGIDWYLINVRRSRCRSFNSRYVVILTDEAKQAIINRMECFY